MGALASRKYKINTTTGFNHFNSSRWCFLYLCLHYQCLVSSLPPCDNYVNYHNVQTCVIIGGVFDVHIAHHLMSFVCCHTPVCQKSKGNCLLCLFGPVFYFASFLQKDPSQHSNMPIIPSGAHQCSPPSPAELSKGGGCRP